MRVFCLFLIIFSNLAFSEKLSDWGPFYRCVKSDGKTVTTGLGPFLQKNSDDKKESSLIAVRPFASVFGTSDMRELDVDVVWPLGEKRVRPDQIKRRALLFGATRKFDKNNPDEQIYASEWMFPLIWNKREKGKDNSLFFIPFFGKIDGGFTFEKSQFFMFPLYGKSQTGETVSNNFLWPFFNYSSGGRATRYRVWPFYAYNRVDGLHERRTLMWPFIHWFRSLDPNVPGSGYFLFPFYGKSSFETVAGDRKLSSKTVMWPFYINYKNQDLEHPEKSSYRTTSWPFYHDTENEEGQDSDSKYYWPFYGKKVRENYKYEYIAWPFWHAFDTTVDETHKSRYLMPFYHHKKSVKDDKLVKESRRIWPFYRSYENQERSFKAFPALFPYSLDEIERNYAPLWTLFSSSKGKNYSSYELLWGLVYSRDSKLNKHWSFFPFIEYDSKKEEADTSYSFLKGLFGFRSKGDKNYYRLFWLPEF